MGLDLSVSRLGLAPAVYWLANSRLLVLAPTALTQSAGVDADTQAVVIQPETGDVRWQPMSAIEASEAVSVQWQLDREVESLDGASVLAASLGGGGARAELRFSGLRVPLPVYNFNLPAFGEKGWQLERRYLGRARLEMRDSQSGHVVVRLTKTLINTPLYPDLHTLATWLPGGRFLVLTPRATGERRLLLVGPFPISQSRPAHARKDRVS